jgi:hypothetical protein
MQWFWCDLLNNTPSFIRVLIVSQYGQGSYYLWPGQDTWVQWFPGAKVMTVFDGNSGQLLYSYTFYVSGPGLYTVSGSGIPTNPYHVYMSPNPTLPHNFSANAPTA